jgi:hypothetical protein
MHPHISYFIDGAITYRSIWFCSSLYVSVVYCNEEVGHERILTAFLANLL